MQFSSSPGRKIFYYHQIQPLALRINQVYNLSKPLQSLMLPVRLFVYRAGGVWIM